jgi:Protein of unknown function (DUF2946)
MKVAQPRHRHRYSDLAAMLGMIAVLIRCVIVPGLMPDIAAAGKGEFKLVICSPNGPLTDGQTPPAHHDGDGLCPYAAFGHLAQIAELPASIAPQYAPGFEAIEPPELVLGTVPRTVRARAPPLAA